MNRHNVWRGTVFFRDFSRGFYGEVVEVAAGEWEWSLHDQVANAVAKGTQPTQRKACIACNRAAAKRRLCRRGSGLKRAA